MNKYKSIVEDIEKKCNRLWKNNHEITFTDTKILSS